MLVLLLKHLDGHLATLPFSDRYFVFASRVKPMLLAEFLFIWVSVVTTVNPGNRRPLGYMMSSYSPSKYRGIRSYCDPLRC